MTGGALVVLFFVFGYAIESNLPRTGLVQRLMILVGWTWLALVCTYLM